MNKLFMEEVMFYLIRQEDCKSRYNSLVQSSLRAKGVRVAEGERGCTEEDLARILFEFTLDEADLFFHSKWHMSWTDKDNVDKPVNLGFIYPHVDGELTRKKAIRVLRRIIVHGTEGEPYITPIDSFGYRRSAWWQIHIAEEWHGKDWRETSDLRKL